MSVGFPWIPLDFVGSLARIESFNGLRGLKQENFFSRFFRGVRSAGTRARGLGMRKGRIVHGASLTWFSDFLQEIVVRDARSSI
jgi:hypothetical protein